MRSLAGTPQNILIGALGRLDLTFLAICAVPAIFTFVVVFFVACLFGITGALDHVGVAAQILDFLTEHGLLPDSLLLLTPYNPLASETTGGVPGVMLFLELWPTAPPGVFYSLALLSSLAGNLLLTGSLTDVLIAERADQMGTRLSFTEHASAGVPIALLSSGLPCFGSR